jgi:hypothetical protein
MYTYRCRNMKIYMKKYRFKMLCKDAPVFNETNINLSSLSISSPPDTGFPYHLPLGSTISCTTSCAGLSSPPLY